MTIQISCTAPCQWDKTNDPSIQYAVLRKCVIAIYAAYIFIFSWTNKQSLFQQYLGCCCVNVPKLIHIHTYTLFYTRFYSGTIKCAITLIKPGPNAAYFYNTVWKYILAGRKAITHKLLQTNPSTKDNRTVTVNNINCSVQMALDMFRFISITKQHRGDIWSVPIILCSGWRGPQTYSSRTIYSTMKNMVSCNRRYGPRRSWSHQVGLVCRGKTLRQARSTEELWQVLWAARELTWQAPWKTLNKSI